MNPSESLIGDQPNKTTSDSNLRENPTIKLLIIGAIILLMLVPLHFIRELVAERKDREREVVDEVSNTWGRAQTVSGPFITIPFVDNMRSSSGQTGEEKFAHFLPLELDITSEIVTDKRHRGIFDVMVYTTNLVIKGKFSHPDMSEFDQADSVAWSKAVLHLGMSDTRSIGDILVMNWNNEKLTMEPGVEGAEIVGEGVHAPLNLSAAGNENEYNFSITFSLHGSEGLRFIPLGKETKVAMTGQWHSPSFQGAFPPQNSEVTKDGFSANWKVIYNNRQFPQQFVGFNKDISSSSFGMDINLPANGYQQNERSVKYAVLIIALTYMIFFFVQVLNRVRIHEVQFLLVGLALCLFYVLLLSFTEHTGFGTAYIIATTMTIALVSLYVRAIFKNNKLSIFNFMMMLLVYGFVFVIIQLESYALLVGSIGLFLVLAVTMYLSRNITWNDELSKK